MRRHAEMLDMLPLNETLLPPPLDEFGFERSFDERGALEWMQVHW